MITKKKLNLAGWLAVIAIIYAFMQTMLSRGLADFFALSLESHLFMNSILSVCYAGLFIYIYITLRRLLHHFANFHETDKYITAFICIIVLIQAANFIHMPSPMLLALIGVPNPLLYLYIKITTIPLYAITPIPLVIIYTGLGLKLLNCSNNLFGYLKPFSYLTIITGVLTAIRAVDIYLQINMHFFATLSGIVAKITFIIFSLIFFKAAKSYDNLNIAEKDRTLSTPR
jgi:hypothetical protein